MEADGIRVFVKQIGHLFLGKPQRLPHQPDIQLYRAVGITVKNNGTATIITWRFPKDVGCFLIIILR